MPQGDSLTILLTIVAFFASTAAAAFLTGYGLEGAKRRNAYAAAGLFALLAVAAFFVPLGGAVQPIKILLFLLALMPIIVVALVAIMISSMRQQLRTAIEVFDNTPVAPAGTATTPAEARETRLRGIHHKVTRVQNDAKGVLKGRAMYADDIVPRMESVLAVIHREFGVETPAAMPTDRESLDVWVGYLDEIGPFLRDGNYEQAKARAINFITSRELQLEQWP